MSRLALNDLLFRLNEAGLEEKLPRLLYILRDELPEESRARINSIQDLFSELKDCRVIHIDNLRPLKEALGLVGRQDLVENVEELERQRAEQTGPLQRYGASLQSNVIRLSRAVKLQCNFRTVSGGVVVVGAALILRRCDSLQEFMNAFTVAVLPAANTLRVISEGSVCFTVQAENLSALQVLWQQYQDGMVQKKMQDFLITEEINQLADDHKVAVNVNIDEQEYIDACLDLTIAKTKAVNKEPLSQRPRRNSDSILQSRSRGADAELFEGEAKRKHHSEHQAKEMEPERLDYVQRYLEKLQDTHSVTSETTDSGLGTKSAPSVVGTEEDNDISDEPRCGDLSYNTIIELSRRLENDKVAWRNVCVALLLTDLGLEAVTLEKVFSFFPATPVRLLQDVFGDLQLFDLVDLLEKPVKGNRSSLLLQRTLQEVKTLQKSDERPTTYHSNVAVLIVYEPDVRANEAIEGIRKLFMELNSDNDVTVIPGLRRKEREWRKEQLKRLRKLSEELEKELNETERTETVAVETINRWIENQGTFSFFVVFDFAGVLSKYTFMMEKLKALSNKAKLIFAPADHLTTFGKLPETLLVSFPNRLGLAPSVIHDAVGKIFDKRWQTLDLCSMMEELRRTMPKEASERMQILDHVSCIVRFKKLEIKDYAALQA